MALACETTKGSSLPFLMFILKHSELTGRP